MLRPGGWAQWSGPDGTTECDTVTCAHCNHVVLLRDETTGKPLSAEQSGGFCRMCMKPTCKGCSDRSCTPFERRLEEMEAHGRLLRSIDE
jgi:hypothetical protein